MTTPRPNAHPDIASAQASFHADLIEEVAREIAANAVVVVGVSGLQPGKKADVNVIDFDGLTLHSPKMIFDLPAGGRRLVQKVDGYDMTICAGVPIFERGEETGNRPGKLVRSTG